MTTASYGLSISVPLSPAERMRNRIAGPPSAIRLEILSPVLRLDQLPLREEHSTLKAAHRDVAPAEPCVEAHEERVMRLVAAELALEPARFLHRRTHRRHALRLRQLPDVSDPRAIDRIHRRVRTGRSPQHALRGRAVRIRVPGQPGAEEGHEPGILGRIVLPLAQDDRDLALLFAREAMDLVHEAAIGEMVFAVEKVVEDEEGAV